MVNFVKISNYASMFKIWIKENWPVLPVLLVALIIRLIYINSNQAVWWDESQHLLLAKHFVYGTPTGGWFEGRSPILAIIDATLFSIFGPSELSIRIFYVFMAVGIVLLTYLIAKNMFDKSVALLAAGITAFFWELFFNTFRLMSEVPGLFFVLLSTYFFVKHYKREPQQNFFRNYKNLIFAAIALVFATLAKYDHAVFGLAFLTAVLLKKDFKGILVFGAAGFLALVPNMIYDLVNYGSILYSAQRFVSPIAIGALTKTFPAITYVQGLLTNFNSILLIALFLIGLIYLLSRIPTMHETFLLSIIVVNFAILLSEFVQDPRFFIRLIPFVAIVIALGVLSVGLRLVKLRQNMVAVLGVSAALIVFVAITHLLFAIPIVEAKSTGYVELKDAGNWLKENTPSSEKIITNADPYLSYYAERASVSIGQNLSDFVDNINNNDVRYVLISAYELRSDTPEHIQKLPQLPFVSLVRSFNYGSQEPRAYIFEINKSIMQNFTTDANN